MPGAEFEIPALLRVLLATGLAAIVGWERERAHRPAGLRTHMTVGLAAALFTTLAQYLALNPPGDGDGIRIDTTRVLEAVVTGVAFLGAGTIFSTREGGPVRGLTTAASLLATAAVGVAAALGTYFLAVGSVLVLLLVLAVLGRLEAKLTASRPSDDDERNVGATPHPLAHSGASHLDQGFLPK